MAETTVARPTRSSDSPRRNFVVGNVECQQGLARKIILQNRSFHVPRLRLSRCKLTKITHPVDNAHL